MHILFLSQDGQVPSGVTTYGRLMLRHCDGTHMLLLNARPGVLGSSGASITTLDESLSHDPARVAEEIRRILPASGLVALLPNTGDTPWEAARLVLKSLAAADRSRIRVLGIVHSDMETQYALAERFLPIARVWIGVSRRCFEELRRRIGPRGAHLHELPYPVEAGEHLVRERQAGGPLRLAFAGRIEEPQKRVSRLTDLFAGLGAAGVDFAATVAGDGPAREEFAAGIGRLEDAVRARVSLVGPLDHGGIEHLWRTHDICLLTSAFEGMPLALLEAMAAGVCPVVMAVESGLPELLVDRVNARVVPQGDVAEMVAVLVELAGDRAQIVRLGGAARATVHGRFSPPVHFRRFRKVLDELWTLPPPDPANVPVDAVGAAVATIVARLCRRGRPVVVFGAGMFGRKLVDACLAEGLDIVALVDSDPARRGWSYRGLTCVGPDELECRSDRVVAIGSMQFAGEMRHRIDEVFRMRGFPCPEVVTLEP